MGRKMVTVVTPQILQVVKKEVPETILQPLQVIMRGGQVMIPQLQAVKREILVTIPQLQVVKREILVMIPQSQAVKKEVQVMVLLPIQMDQIRVGSITADRKSTRLNSSHVAISYAVFCLKKKTTV